MTSYVVMVDMDQTLIESVFKGDKRYESSPGHPISYVSLDDPARTITEIKVAVRPHACQFVKAIIDAGHRYILWSAGTYYYVHAVMEYFIKLSKVAPELIYTRFDMVESQEKAFSTPSLIDANNFGRKFKSMISKGFPKENVIIIEDNPSLVNPSERDRVITVKPWVFENSYDHDLEWVSRLMGIYQKFPLTENGTGAFQAGSSEPYTIRTVRQEHEETSPRVIAVSDNSGSYAVQLTGYVGRS